MLTARLRVQLVPGPDSLCDLQGLCLTNSVQFPNLSAQRVAQESQAPDPGAPSELITESETEDESRQGPRDSSRKVHTLPDPRWPFLLRGSCCPDHSEALSCFFPGVYFRAPRRSVPEPGNHCVSLFACSHAKSLILTQAHLLARLIHPSCPFQSPEMHASTLALLWTTRLPLSALHLHLDVQEKPDP
ncbi:unnamed protein product [Rangifer tarandus platyrhynchus]|uniref:Uncharacterized protein n=1 Tax=Rangifer tarandus platyrhynchus TaxID=3082113 RepID=A0ABN8Y6R5_RANTA|nr:unnamed protein product [Rangifer tarandus platyrhynchus]